MEAKKTPKGSKNERTAEGSGLIDENLKTQSQRSLKMIIGALDPGLGHLRLPRSKTNKGLTDIIWVEGRFWL